MDKEKVGWTRRHARVNIKPGEDADGTHISSFFLL